jgi:hypothetical protein
MSVIVFDSNKKFIKVTAPGPQGAPAPEVEVQYSESGENWHDIATTSDNYFRFSTDGGVTWGEPLQTVQSGALTDLERKVGRGIPI